MIKSWLITTSAPYVGTDQYYSAFAENKDKLLDWLYTNWFDEECQNLYDSYAFRLQDSWDDEYNENSDEYEDYDDFMCGKYEEWCQDCDLNVEECSEEDLHGYGYDGELPEIIYDQREK